MLKLLKWLRSLFVGFLVDMLQGSYALRFLVHVLIALVFGYLYQDVGRKADTLMANFIFVYGSNLFLHYTGQMAVTLACK